MASTQFLTKFQYLVSFFGDLKSNQLQKGVTLNSAKTSELGDMGSKLKVNKKQ